jgi:5-methylcytosine-specific restriction endonuclease McrA
MASYTNQQLQIIWNKGGIIPSIDPSIWRHDSYGHVIRWSDYGLEVEHGWEVDHIKPKAKGGSDALSNLQPLHWKANRQKSDNSR